MNVSRWAGSILGEAAARAALEDGKRMDEDLVARAASGDHDAFASLATGHINRCYAIAYRVLRDPDRAKDATQQALLGAWRDLPMLRDYSRFEAWLHRLVVHACYAEARTTRRWSARLRVVAADGIGTDPTTAVVDRAALDDAFGRLTPEHRAVVVLHHHLGYPLTEIAATLGIPVGTARSRLHYAVRQLRTVLEADRVSASLAEERPA